MASILIASCTHEDKLKQSIFAKSGCLQKHANCDGVYSFDSTSIDVQQNYLYAKWLIRKEEYQEAKQIFTSIKDTSKEFTQSQFLIAEINLSNSICWYNINDPLISTIDEKIKISLRENDILSSIYLLNKKSSRLTENGEYDYGFATAYYAEHLRQSIKNIDNPNTNFIPFSILATAFDQNKNVKAAGYFYRMAINSRPDESPSMRQIKVYYESLDHKLNSAEIDELKHKYIDRTQYAKAINKNIETDLYSQALDPHISIKHDLKQLSIWKPTCDDDYLYTVEYLIDAYLGIGNLIEAENWLKSLIDCNTESGMHLFQQNHRKQQLLFAKYKRSHDPKLLEKVILASKEIVQNYSSHSKSIVNLHFADAIFTANNMYIDALFELHKIDKISDIALIQALNEVKQLYSKISDTQSVLGSFQANEDIAQKVSRLKFDIEKLEVKTDRYRDTTLQDYSIYEKLHSLHKELFDIKQSLPSISDSTISEIKKVTLKKNARAIDILMTENKYYITSISSKGVHMDAFEREFIDSLNSKIKHSIQTQTKINTPELKELSEIMTKHLSSSDTDLVIIPDGSFFGLPVESILHEGQQLVDRIDITYATDINGALNQDEYVFSAPSLTTWSYSSDATNNATTKIEIAELPIGLEECEKVNQLYTKTNFLQGNDLNSQSWSSTIDSDIIHISSHSYSSLSNILGNYISIRNKDGKPIPLYGFEIKQQDFKDKLVILSSCNSGTGKQQDGTGIFSISRDIFQAGAQTVIKSLWAVNERSTKELMVAFHHNLNSGYSASMALTMAKRTMKRNPEYSHPFYWAGFVLEGNPNVRIM